MSFIPDSDVSVKPDKKSSFIPDEPTKSTFLPDIVSGAHDAWNKLGEDGRFEHVSKNLLDLWGKGPTTVAEGVGERAGEFAQANPQDPKSKLMLKAVPYMLTAPAAPTVWPWLAGFEAIQQTKNVAMSAKGGYKGPLEDRHLTEFTDPILDQLPDKGPGLPPINPMFRTVNPQLSILYEASDWAMRNPKASAKSGATIGEMGLDYLIANKVSEFGGALKASLVPTPELKAAYDTMGLSPFSTSKEVDAAYRNLALKAHPDRGGNIADMQKINAAKEMIDANRKTALQKIFDLFRHPDTQVSPEDIKNAARITNETETVKGERSAKLPSSVEEFQGKKPKDIQTYDIKAPEAHLEGPAAPISGKGVSEVTPKEIVPPSPPSVEPGSVISPKLEPPSTRQDKFDPSVQGAEIALNHDPDPNLRNEVRTVALAGANQQSEIDLAHKLYPNAKLTVLNAYDQADLKGADLVKHDARLPLPGKYDRYISQGMYDLYSGEDKERLLENARASLTTKGKAFISDAGEVSKTWINRVLDPLPGAEVTPSSPAPTPPVVAEAPKPIKTEPPKMIKERDQVKIEGGRTGKVLTQSSTPGVWLVDVGHGMPVKVIGGSPDSVLKEYIPPSARTAAGPSVREQTFLAKQYPILKMIENGELKPNDLYRRINRALWSNEKAMYYAAKKSGYASPSKGPMGNQEFVREVEATVVQKLLKYTPDKVAANKENMLYWGIDKTVKEVLQGMSVNPLYTQSRTVKKTLTEGAKKLIEFRDQTNQLVEQYSEQGIIKNRFEVAKEVLAKMGATRADALNWAAEYSAYNQESTSAQSLKTEEGSEVEFSKPEMSPQAFKSVGEMLEAGALDEGHIDDKIRQHLEDVFQRAEGLAYKDYNDQRDVVFRKVASAIERVGIEKGAFGPKDTALFKQWLDGVIKGHAICALDDLKSPATLAKEAKDINTILTAMHDLNIEEPTSAMLKARTGLSRERIEDMLAKYNAKTDDIDYLQKHDIKVDEDKAVEHVEGKKNLLGNTAGFIIIPTPKDLIRSGQEAGEAVLLFINPADNMGTQFARKIDDWHKHKLLHTMDAEDVLKEWHKVFPNNSELSKKASNAVEQPEKYASELSAYQKSAIRKGKAWLESIHEKAVENDIFYGHLADYIPHIVLDNPTKTKSIMGSKLGDFVAQSKQRKGPPTLEALKAAGLHPLEDFGKLMTIPYISLMKAIENRELIDFLYDFKTPDGLPAGMVAHKAPDHYVEVPGLKKMSYIGDHEKEVVPWEERNKLGREGMRVKTVQSVKPDGTIETRSFEVPKTVAEIKAMGIKPKLIEQVFFMEVATKWHPEVADVLKRLVDAYTPEDERARLFWKVKGLIKRAIVLNPLIHTANTLGNALPSTIMHPLATIKAMRMIVTDQRGMMRLAVKDGVNISGIGKDLGLAREEIENEILDKDNPNGLWTKLKYPITKIFELNDRLLWDGIVRNLQLTTWAVRKDILEKRYAGKLSKESVGRIAALETNSLMGTLTKEWMSPFSRQAGSLLTFARNWTFSNVSEVFAVFGRGLGTQGLTQKERWAYGDEFRRFWLKSVIMFVMSSDILNRAFTKSDTEPFGHDIWDNEEGHRTDIQLPFKSKQGGPEYVFNPLFRAGKDVVMWATHPDQVMINKMDAMLKMAFEEVFNIQLRTLRTNSPKNLVDPNTPWNWSTPDPKALAHGKNVELPGQLQIRAQHILHSTTPISQVYGNVGEVKTPQEEGIGEAGMYVSHGLIIPKQVYKEMSHEDKGRVHKMLTVKEEEQFGAMIQQGKFTGNVAHKIKAVSEDTKTRRAALDKIINTTGYGEGREAAKEIMDATERYKSRFKGVPAPHGPKGLFPHSAKQERLKEYEQ